MGADALPGFLSRGPQVPFFGKNSYDACEILRGDNKVLPELTQRPHLLACFAHLWSMDPFVLVRPPCSFLSPASLNYSHSGFYYQFFKEDRIH